MKGYRRRKKTGFILPFLFTLLFAAVIALALARAEDANGADFAKLSGITGQSQDALKKSYESMSSVEREEIDKKFDEIKKLELIKKKAADWDIKSLQQEEGFATKAMWKPTP